jgi:hypothetical protein
MYGNKKVGITQTLMSALSILVVRSRPKAVRKTRTPDRPDAAARASIARAQIAKESYLAMARQSRWNR